ncbi:MAG: hypothetical protein AAGA68_10170 [Pseudomonadota bacterium]
MSASTSQAVNNPPISPPIAAPIVDAEPGDSVDWGRVFFSLYEQLDARAERRFRWSPDGAAAFDYALCALSEDGWAILRSSYRQVGAPEAFLATCFYRLLENYARAKMGRRRPPAWVQRRGALWVRVFSARVQHEPDEAIIKRVSRGDEVIQAEVVAILRELKTAGAGAGPPCGEVLLGVPLELAVQHKGLLEDERELLLSTLGRLASSANRHHHPSSDDDTLSTRAYKRALDALCARVHLDESQRHLLTLRVQEGSSFRVIGERLGCGRRVAERRFKSLITQLKDALRDCGIDGARES